MKKQNACLKIKKSFLFILSLIIVSFILTACDLFGKNTPDETDGMSLITYEQLKKDLENQEEWTKGYWKLSIKQIKKTKRSTITVYVDNFPLFEEGDPVLAYFASAFIEPIEEELKNQNNSSYVNPIPNDDEPKEQYIETLDSHEIYINNAKNLLIYDVYTTIYDNKNQLTTNVTNRYTLTKN